MKSIWQQNKTYFIGFAILLLAASLAILLIQKGDLVLFFSGHRTPFYNYFFRLTNAFAEGYAFAIVLLFLLFYRLRYALAVLVAGFLAMFVSQGLKHFFGHPRPSKYLTEIIAEPVEIIAVPEVELVSSYTSSFPSGHTTAAFTLYTLLALFFPQRIWQISCLLLATLAALARVYLGQHFLEDITAGAFCGLLIGLFLYLLQERLARAKWSNKAFLSLGSNQQ